jgi:hypothetical protein
MKIHQKTSNIRITNFISIGVVAVVWMLAPLHFARGVTLAIDDASQPAYADGWQAGDNGGTGFGSWAFAYSGSGAGLVHPAQFIDTGPLPGDSLGAPTFSLSTEDNRNAFETSEVQRGFVSPIGIGQTFSSDVNGSALDPSAPAYSIGNTFDLLGTNGSYRFSLFTNNQYHSDHWTATGDADTGVPAGNAFHAAFKLVTTNSYDLVLSPIGGGTSYFTQTGAPLAGTAGVAINRLRITDYGTGSSADGSKELFFDNLLLIGPLPGDFNNDNIVNAADYVIWRKNGLDANSYNLWRTHFGQSASGSASQSEFSQVAVPEPVSATLMLMSFIGYVAWIGHRFLRGVSSGQG